MPYPIQLGPLTERLRKFFRLRGKTNFMLDEVVVPVAMVQDLTVGPYQAGVSPVAFTMIAPQLPGFTNQIVIFLNDKAGTVAAIGQEFAGRSFSVTWIEVQLIVVMDGTNGPPYDIEVFVIPRSREVANVQPITAAARAISIQNNDGSRTLPVNMLFHDQGGLFFTDDEKIWQGILGNNTNTLGSRRTLEPQPNVTIGPDDAILIQMPNGGTGFDANLAISIRGFYQEQTE